MKKSRTILILIISIITTILVICLFVFFLKIIKNKNEHTSAVLSTLEQKMKEKENTAMFSEKITEIKSIQSSIDSHFVDPNEIDVFVGYLENIGIRTGVNVLVKNIEIPLKTKNVISCKLSIVGNFQGVAKTIALLENIPYQVNVTQMYINKETMPLSNEEIKSGKVIGSSSWQADISFNILSSQ